MKTGNKKIVIKRLINKMQGLTCCVLAGLFVSAMINILYVSQSAYLEKYGAIVP